MRKRTISIVLAAALAVTSLYRPASAVETSSLVGAYTIQGAKGPITLTLKNEEGGKLSGSLKGGELQATLKGFPAEGKGVLGTVTGLDGKFLSYFQVTREGDTIQFDIVQANADGDPDFNQKSRISFPTGGAKADTAKPDTTKPDNTKPDNTKPDNTKPEPPKPAPGAPAGTASTNFAGVFKDDTLTLESKAAGATYSGSIKMAGQNFTFTARAEGTVLRGEFESPDGKFPFEATLEGRILKFVTDGTTYTLNKQGNPLAKPPGATTTAGPANPLVKPNTPAGTAPGNTASGNTAPGGAPAVVNLPNKSSGNAAWKIYKHATGLSVRYPPDWKIDVQNGVGLLTPPDVAQTATGSAEVYLLFANGSEGVTSVEDPRVVPFVEQQMKQLAPFMQRVGDAQKLATGAAAGVLLSWEGTNPAGMDVRANIMATILKGYAVTLMAMGDKTKIAARESVLKEVFTSLAAGVGERDPNLVGQWKFWGYKSSADGKFGTETTRRFRFLEDGTCLWQSNSESSGSVEGRNSLGEQTFTGGVAGTGGNADKGQWTAANGQLYVLWGDGSTGTWTYEVKAVNGKRLFLKDANNKADEWIAE